MSGLTPSNVVRGVIPVRVLLVDDQQMLVEALAAKLSTTPDIVVVGHCTTGDPQPDGLATLLRPDVITVELPRAGEADTLLSLFRAAWPPARFVVLTASRDPEQAAEAARAGADGWVSKESSIEELTHALRCASRGHASFPPEYLGHILGELRADVGRAQRRDGPLDVLTPRERDVLMCFAQGRGPAEIADELGMSAHTVRTHTNKIFAKLGVHSRLEAVTLAWGTQRNAWAPHVGASRLAAAPDVPVRDVPVRDVPVRDAPVRDAPVRDAPVRDAPVRDVPVRKPVASVGT
ncbi:MAG TPA: response regulator transcription factor [Pseudonocardiaceae bacterium]|nr:response regulator transcription factor [Pseudonocardiaceae bacterium]